MWQPKQRSLSACVCIVAVSSLGSCESAAGGSDAAQLDGDSATDCYNPQEDDTWWGDIDTVNVDDLGPNDDSDSFVDDTQGDVSDTSEPSPRFISPLETVTDAEGIELLRSPAVLGGSDTVLLSCGTAADGSTVGLFDASTGMSLWSEPWLKCYDAHLVDLPPAAGETAATPSIVGCGPNACWSKNYDQASSSFGMTIATSTAIGKVTDMQVLDDDEPSRILIALYSQNGVGSLSPKPNATPFGDIGWGYDGFMLVLDENAGANGSIVSAWAPSYADGALIAITDGGDLWWTPDFHTPLSTERVQTGLGSDLRRVRCLGDHCVVTDYGSDLLTVLEWGDHSSAPIVRGTIEVGDGPVGLDIRKDNGDWLVVSTGSLDGTYTLTRIDDTFTVTESVTTEVDGRCSGPGHAVFLPDSPGSPDSDPSYVAVSCHDSANALFLEY